MDIENIKDIDTSLDNIENIDTRAVGKTHVLIVGCNYEGTSYKLNGCINDAEAMYELFDTYHKNNSRHYARPAMIKDNVRHAVFDSDYVKKHVNAVYNRCKSGDTFIMYFSGHGTQVRDDNNDEKDGLDEVCVINMKRGLPFRKAYLVDDELVKILHKESVKTVMLFDCCHSGGMDDIAKGKNKLVIAACAEHQTAKEAKLPNGNVRGFFTLSLEKMCHNAKEPLSLIQILKNPVWKKLITKFDQNISVFGDRSLLVFPPIK
jgi:hypothetical protein